MFHVLVSWHEVDNCGMQHFDDTSEWYDLEMTTREVVMFRKMLKDLDFKECKNAVQEAISGAFIWTPSQEDTMG